MKEKLLDVMKWGLILIIAGAVFYAVYPKYYFPSRQGSLFLRCNKITGSIVMKTKEGWQNKNITKKAEKIKKSEEKYIVWNDESLEDFEKRYRKEQLEKWKQQERSREHLRIMRKVNAELEAIGKKPKIDLDFGLEGDSPIK